MYDMSVDNMIRLHSHKCQAAHKQSSKYIKVHSFSALLYGSQVLYGLYLGDLYNYTEGLKNRLDCTFIIHVWLYLAYYYEIKQRYNFCSYLIHLPYSSPYSIYIITDG